MFSPVKTLAGAALVFAVGGAFLVAQPLGQQGINPPGAEPEPLVAELPSVFSGEIHATGPGVRGGWRWTPKEMTDPRLDGTAFYAGSEGHPTDDTWVGWWTFRIVNDDGAWQTSFPGFSWGIEGVDDDGLGPEVFTTLLYGEGAYEGLVAVTVIDIYRHPSGWTVNGVIVDADELPEPPVAARPYGSE